MQTTLSYEQAKNHSGWLEKKSYKALGGYQRRFFRILEGQVILYGNKENDKSPKGHIPMVAIMKVTKKEDKKFHLELDFDRVVKLKAKNEEDRDRWVAVIELLLSKINNNEECLSPRRSRSEIPMKLNKMNEVDKNVLELMRNAGIEENEDSKINKKFLEKKKITEFLQINNPDIAKRLYSGFLFKRKINTNLYSKDWLFLFSSRPLKDEDYETDDKTLEDNKLKGWIKYDVLFVFKGKDKDKEKNNVPKYGLEMKNCHTIKCEDKDEKYFLNVEIGDEIHIFYSEIRGERDIWFEVLKNSRQTAKEICNSITQKPKNMKKLLNIYEIQGKEQYLEEIQKERSKVLGEYFNISDFETLKFVINEYTNMINSMLDGCLLFYKDYPELLQITYDNLSETYVKIITTFWDNNFSQISNENIMELSRALFSFLDNIKKFHIEDINLKKNGNEFVKIYIKNIYKTVIDFIQNILKTERAKKVWDENNGELTTSSPQDLFTIYNNVAQTNKNIKISYVHSYVLNMLYEGIIQFLIGIDCASSNYKIKIEEKYLITISNNTVTILNLLNEFIENYKEGCVLSEKKINEEIHIKSLVNALNLLRQNTITRFVIELSKPLADSFNCYYHLLDLEEILKTTSKIYLKYNTLMNTLVRKKTWEEILKLTVYYYMKLLIMTANKGVKNAEDLIDRLNKHRNSLKDVYSPVVGGNLTDVNLKIFDDLVSFLRVDSSLISSSILPLREYIGKIFNLEIVGRLLAFRVDLNREQIEDAINTCREILEQYKETDNNENKNFFDVLEEKTERRQSVRKRMQKKKDERKSKISTNESKTEQKNENDENDLATKIFNYEDFVFDENDIEKEDGKEKDNEKENKEKRSNRQSSIIVENETVSDVIMEGYLLKKSYPRYHQRYFQLKSGALYWFPEKNSRKLSNKVYIKDVLKVVSEDENKFIITYEEENDVESGKVELKLKSKDEKTKEDWIKAITSEMNKIKGKSNEKNNIYYKTEVKKKLVVDYFKLPDIGAERTKIKLQIASQIQNENEEKIDDTKRESCYSNFDGEYIEVRPVQSSLCNITSKGYVEDNNKYNPHAELFNQGKLQQYDIGLEVARESKSGKGVMGCCQNFFSSLCGIFSKKEEKPVEVKKK